MEEYEVAYTRYVIDFMMERIESERVYNRIDEYRTVLSHFPDIGGDYDPHYDAARPPFPCKRIAVPGTPFTLYYRKDEEERRVTIFYIEHQRADPRGRFSASAS